MLTTSTLDISAKHGIGKPHQGIEPMQAQGHEGQEFHSRVTAADVMLFMGDDVAKLPICQSGGQVDLRFENTHDEG